MGDSEYFSFFKKFGSIFQTWGRGILAHHHYFDMSPTFQIVGDTPPPPPGFPPMLKYMMSYTCEYNELFMFSFMWLYMYAERYGYYYNHMNGHYDIGWLDCLPNCDVVLIFMWAWTWAIPDDNHEKTCTDLKKQNYKIGWLYFGRIM